MRDLYGGSKPNGDALSPAVKVRVTGGLFYDSQHFSKTKPHGGGNRGTNHCATNLWEIHPLAVTAAFFGQCNIIRYLPLTVHNRNFAIYSPCSLSIRQDGGIPANASDVSVATLGVGD